MSTLATAGRITVNERPRYSVVIEDEVRVPVWVVDLESFRRWGDSDEFPETGRIDYLRGELWVDMSPEQIFSHNQVKTEYIAVLGALVRENRLGRFFADGVRLTSISADFSVVPDGTFVKTAAFHEGRVRLVKGKRGGYVELEGIPDMALEILSASSVHKDTEELFELYRQAGIPEYWLVDARKEPLRFDIFRHTAKSYAAVRKQAGWLKSAVFGKSFKLTQRVNGLGHPEYTLAVR